jgi:tetratricopeptide (TPR) repeat protein
MKKQLNKEAESKIQNLGKIGRAAWLQGNIEQAEEIFLQCWDTIPEPKLDYNYSQILSGGLVKFFRDSHQIEKAKNWITIMRKAYEPGINLDVEFLAATVYYEENELSKAYEIFQNQYETYGSRPFEGENKKYLDFTISRTKGQ